MRHLNEARILPHFETVAAATEAQKAGLSVTVVSDPTKPTKKWASLPGMGIDGQFVYHTIQRKNPLGGPAAQVIKDAQGHPLLIETTMPEEWAMTINIWTGAQAGQSPGEDLDPIFPNEGEVLAFEYQIQRTFGAVMAGESSNGVVLVYPGELVTGALKQADLFTKYDRQRLEALFSLHGVK